MKNLFVLIFLLTQYSYGKVHNLELETYSCLELEQGSICLDEYDTEAVRASYNYSQAETVAFIGALIKGGTKAAKKSGGGKKPPARGRKGGGSGGGPYTLTCKGVVNGKKFNKVVPALSSVDCHKAKITVPLVAINSGDFVNCTCTK